MDSTICNPLRKGRVVWDKKRKAYVEHNSAEEDAIIRQADARKRHIGLVRQTHKTIEAGFDMAMGILGHRITQAKRKTQKVATSRVIIRNAEEKLGI